MRLRWPSREAAFSQDRSSKSHSQQDAYESKLISRGYKSQFFVGDLMSLNGPIPVSLSLVPSIVFDILLICFACFAYCGKLDVKVWHKGKPKSGYLSVSVKQETSSLARKISRDPSSAHEK